MFLRLDPHKKLKKNLAKSSHKRQAIFATLFTRQWFLETDVKIHHELLSLPADFDGYLADLADRPEELGGIRILKLESLHYGNFQIISVFKVHKISVNRTYTYEYISWKTGRYCGYKGLIFVRQHDKITHFVLLKGQKFATGTKEIYYTIGGFMEHGEEGAKTLLQKIDREIKEELGVSTLKISNIYDLGRILPDAGMTNQEPGIFVAIIDAENTKGIKNQPENADIRELDTSLLVLPIEDLKTVILEAEDCYFLACMAKLKALKVVDF